MEYTLIRRRGQKSIRIRVGEGDKIIVSCPYFVSTKEIERLLCLKKQWIEAQRKKFVSHTYQTGDSFVLFGRTLVLNVVNCSYNLVKEENNRLFVFTKKNNAAYIKKLLRDYYSYVLMDFCKERLAYWISCLKLRTPNLQIGNAKAQWGVCYPSKNLIRISLISATLDPGLLDMIVLHETCHLVFCNHQKEFYSLMEKFMPDYKEKNTRFRQVAKTGIHRNLF